MSKHTPGPWFAIESDPKYFPGHGYRINRNSDGFAWDLAHVCNAPNESANARLIAAAPELLEALKSMLGMHEEGATLHGLVGPTVASARAAIAKATGGQQ